MSATETLDATTSPADEEPAVAPDPAAGGEGPGPARGDGGDGGDDEGGAEKPAVRIAIAIAFPVIGAAVMVGGIFSGVSPRIYGTLAGLLGVGLAVGVSRLTGKTFLSYALMVGGLFGIGLLMLLPDVGNMFQVTKRIEEATSTGDVLRPPVDFEPGWKAIQGWVMGMVGFTAAWVAIVVKWRSFALFLPLPVAAAAAISVPESAQIPSGIVVLVLFAIGLGLVASEQSAGDDEEGRPSLAYELRKALKALPLLVAITAALIVMSNAGFLFPDPLHDPAQEPQRPKTQPLSEVDPERVLFEVDSNVTGPFRMGSLDVYMAEDGSWRLPPFAASDIDPVPKDGIVDEEFRDRQELQAEFIIRGLGGAVLPDLPNTVGIAAVGPKLSFDPRNGNIRLVNGKAEPGMKYLVTAAGLPSVEDLKTLTLADLPPEIEQFTEIPDPPLAVQDLIGQAPASSKWEQFDWLRTWILDNVVAEGTGSPVEIKPDRVADMIAGSQRGTPFEIVAAQAMLARWIGVPSRIGYGFNGSDDDRTPDGLLQIRPLNGAAFVEVWFPGHKWLPVIGEPKQAEPTVGSDPQFQKQDPLIVPSDEIRAQLYLPLLIEPGSVLGQQIALIVLVAMPVALLLFLAYVLYPALKKARLRSRRREQAIAAGSRARIALAYSEWRDYATDLGFGYPTETPLMFLERFADDDEHTELAWLTTRALWGDLRDSLTPEMAAAAEELSRSLRRRLASVQPASLRAVAIVSRLSLRDPYMPDPETPHRGPRLRRKEREHEAVPA